MLWMRLIAIFWNRLCWLAAGDRRRLRDRGVACASISDISGVSSLVSALGDSTGSRTGTSMFLGNSTDAKGKVATAGSVSSLSLMSPRSSFMVGTCLSFSLAFFGSSASCISTSSSLVSISLSSFEDSVGVSLGMSFSIGFSRASRASRAARTSRTCSWSFSTSSRPFRTSSRPSLFSFTSCPFVSILSSSSSFLLSRILSLCDAGSSLFAILSGFSVSRVALLPSTSILSLSLSVVLPVVSLSAFTESFLGTFSEAFSEAFSAGAALSVLSTF